MNNLVSELCYLYDFGSTGYDFLEKLAAITTDAWQEAREYSVAHVGMHKYSSGVPKNS